MPEYVEAQQVYNEAVQLLSGTTPEGAPAEKDLDRAETLINELLNANPQQPMCVYLAGSLALSRDQFGLAVALLTQVIQSAPKIGEAWNNLGIAWSNLRDQDKARAAFMQSYKRIKNHDLPNNIAATYLNHGTPEEALKWIAEAMQYPGAMDDPKLQWHAAIANLELRQYTPGWQLHEARLHGGGNNDVAHRNYAEVGETPVWDYEAGGLVAVHGEEGIGDEIMFGTCLPDMLRHNPHTTFVIECGPRLHDLFTRSLQDYDNVHVRGTHKTDGSEWISELGRPDHKIALGSLPLRYRPERASFTGEPWLVASPGHRFGVAEKLRPLGARPKIGVAWQGGVHSTRWDARSMHPSALAPIFSAVDATWVSLQYDRYAEQNVAECAADTGVQIHHWPDYVEAIDPVTGKGSNIDKLAAVISELDLVITVCQTAVHVAGALGVPCWVMTPRWPSWRYSATADVDMPWYASVELFRQRADEADWSAVLKRISERVKQWSASSVAAE